MHSELIDKAKLAFGRKHPELNADEVEDFIQDAWVLLELTSPPDVQQDEGRSFAYLLGCAENLFLNWRRKHRRTTSLDAMTEKGFDVTAADRSDQFIDEETVARILRQLDPFDAEIVRLKWIDGLKLHEIAERYEMTTASVKKRHERALKKLKAKLLRRGGG